LKHQHLPLLKSYAQGGHHSLLDNEVVLHNMCIYLATQTLGTVRPLSLCQHINAVILPALEIEGRIVEYTAQHWLKFKLRYECKEARKGVYIDGHECLDVIEERKEFLE